jgi:uncharacterized membrane protein
MTPASLESQFSEIASYIALVIEAGAVLVVAFGALQAILGVVGSILRRSADELTGREIWLKFATWILLASNSLLPPTLCARRWRRPGKISPSLR